MRSSPAKSACAWRPPDPGAIHLLNGLYDAKLDHQPVLAIVGQQPRTSIGGSYQQEVDLHTLFKDVAGEYVHTVTACRRSSARHHRPRRTHRARRADGDLPDLPRRRPGMKTRSSSPPHEHGTCTPAAWVMPPPRIVAARDELDRAARCAERRREGGDARRPRRAAGADDEVMEIAEQLGAGVAKALLGKDVVPDDLPFVTGAIGLLGTRPSYDMMMDCDMLFMIGSSFPLCRSCCRHRAGTRRADRHRRPE